MKRNRNKKNCCRGAKTVRTKGSSAKKREGKKIFRGGIVR